jgi:PKHD-type hydroxylase
MIYPIPPRQSTGKDYTAYWDNFLTEEEINKILAYPEWLEQEAACVGSAEGVVNAGIRTSEVGWLDLRPDTVWLWEKITKVIAEVNSQYFKFDLTGCYTPMQLGVYKASDSGHYDWHTDTSPTERNAPRKLSMSLLLSDSSEFEGGEFQVKAIDDNIQTLDTRRGRAWFFPAYTLHRVAPVTKGVRRSLVLWVSGPEFK